MEHTELPEDELVELKWEDLKEILPEWEPFIPIKELKEAIRDEHPEESEDEILARISALLEELKESAEALKSETLQGLEKSSNPQVDSHFRRHSAIYGFLGGIGLALAAGWVAGKTLGIDKECECLCELDPPSL